MRIMRLLRRIAFMVLPAFLASLISLRRFMTLAMAILTGLGAGFLHPGLPGFEHPGFPSGFLGSGLGSGFLAIIGAGFLLSPDDAFAFLPAALEELELELPKLDREIVLVLLLVIPVIPALPFFLEPSLALSRDSDIVS